MRACILWSRSFITLRKILAGVHEGVEVTRYEACSRDASYAVTLTGSSLPDCMTVTSPSLPRTFDYEQGEWYFIGSTGEVIVNASGSEWGLWHDHAPTPATQPSPDLASNFITYRDFHRLANDILGLIIAKSLVTEELDAHGRRLKDLETGALKRKRRVRRLERNIVDHEGDIGRLDRRITALE